MNSKARRHWRITNWRVSSLRTSRRIEEQVKTQGICQDSLVAFAHAAWIYLKQANRAEGCWSGFAKVLSLFRESSLEISRGLQVEDDKLQLSTWGGLEHQGTNMGCDRRRANQDVNINRRGRISNTSFETNDSKFFGTGELSLWKDNQRRAFSSFSSERLANMSGASQTGGPNVAKPLIVQQSFKCISQFGVLGLSESLRVACERRARSLH